MYITNQDPFLISNSQNIKPEIQWLTIESDECLSLSARVRVYDTSPRAREQGEGYITLYSLDNYAN